MSSVVLPIETADGTFVAHYSDKGLIAIEFPDKNFHATFTGSPSKEIKSWHELTSSAVKNILLGKRPATLPPLHIIGTKFQEAVWAVLRQIQLGETLSYGEVAAQLGNPGATRAVGSACGANLIPLIIPCHRVLAANRRLGGFSGGLSWKMKLLVAEGASFEKL